MILLAGCPWIILRLANCSPAIGTPQITICMIFLDMLQKTFNQMSLSGFMVLIQKCLTVYTVNFLGHN